jgi:hypothetical protein
MRFFKDKGMVMMRRAACAVSFTQKTIGKGTVTYAFE